MIVDEKLRFGIIMMNLESYGIDSVDVNYYQSNGHYSKIIIEDRITLNRYTVKINDNKKLKKIRRWDKIKTLIIEKSQDIIKSHLSMNKGTHRGHITINIPSGEYDIQDTVTIVNYNSEQHKGKIMDKLN